MINYDPEKKTVIEVIRKDPSASILPVASSKKFPIITAQPERDTASSSGRSQ